jgi:hypothetical protein
MLNGTRFTNGAIIMTRGLFPTALFLAAIACAPPVWRVQYLSEQVNVATEDQVQTKFGPPLGTQRLESGDTVWTYRVGKNARYGDPATYGEGSVLIGSGECVSYALTFDKQHILRSWLRQEC